MKVSLNWLKEFIEIDLSYQELAYKLTMAGIEVENIERLDALDDTIFELNITPNRADCLSIYGVARELGCILGKDLKTDPKAVYDGVVTKTSSSGLVEVIDMTDCPRYSAIVIEGINIGESPEWMKARLIACGMRPINNIVDITNYVMLELGQPLHAFDYNLIAGRKVIVRKAFDGEIFNSLEGRTIELDRDVLVIADTNKAIAMAGIIGGIETSTNDNTKHILLESACFNPVNVLKTARKHGFTTESSLRFARGTDPEGVIIASKRAIELIKYTNKKDVVILNPLIDIYSIRHKPIEITVRVDRVNKILGTDISYNQVKDILSICCTGVKEIDTKTLLVVPPSYRMDITREIDIIEEIARLNVYENISATMPQVTIRYLEKDKLDIKIDMIKDIMVGMGFYEAINYSFINQDTATYINTLTDGCKDIYLRNPISMECSLMRNTLLIGLLNNIKRNINNDIQDIKLFEVGRVFYYDETNGYLEKTCVCSVVTDFIDKRYWKGKDDKRDYFDIKGTIEVLLERVINRGALFKKTDIPLLSKGNVEASIPLLTPATSALISIGNKEVGYIGEIHPNVLNAFDIGLKVYAFEIDITELLSFQVKTKRYKKFSKYPVVFRDISITVDNTVTNSDIISIIKSGSYAFLEDIILFDSYKGGNIPNGKKSLSYSFIFTTNERTLVDNEIDSIYNCIVNDLKEKLNAELRT